MTHPEQLLADYVHGSLTPTERAAVDAHLATCGTCTDEVAAARAARAALMTLPVESPGSLADGVRAAAAVTAAEARRRRSAPRWQRWAGSAAAVAAAALVLTLVLPKIGGGGSNSDRAAPEATTAVTGPDTTSAVRLELRSTDYAEADLPALASDSAKQLAAQGGEASASTISGVPTKVGSPGSTQAATDCILQAFQQVPGTAVRLIRARFLGAPAYIGLYAETPGGGQAADALTVRVASVQGCTPLSIAQIPL